ncbi:hypothetical protein E3N88_36145 [Mikania micrantha]|uniref:Uncharacterized protein n=1 Tax=Mikania micrantha TaxID=192012 RepID=A0A5N6M2Y0_9ASTR|nr:hypothetical protein E3N88_36145 [Mikania micrantha]
MEDEDYLGFFHWNEIIKNWEITSAFMALSILKDEVIRVEARQTPPPTVLAVPAAPISSASTTPNPPLISPSLIVAEDGDAINTSEVEVAVAADQVDTKDINGPRFFHWNEIIKNWEITSAFIVVLEVD